MQKIILITLLFITACSSKPSLKTAQVVLPPPPKDALELSKALEQGAEPTLQYLKSHVIVKSYGDLPAHEPMLALPASLRAEKSVAANKAKSEQWQFIKKFRTWSSAKRMKKAQEMDGAFSCENVVEAQSVAYTLEIDFPTEEAMTMSRSLHEKVLTCPEYAHNESIFRLAVFAIQKDDCARANDYLSKFPAKVDRGVSDRAAYLRNLCGKNEKTAQTEMYNPWGGYGILLNDDTYKANAPKWYLTAQSGSEEWDRLLATFVELSEKNRPDTIRYIASKMNYETFRTLPLSFQTSVLVLMSFSGADLSVFQAVHKYLSENPAMVSPSVAGLLFPIRYWKEIVENNKCNDPILVKALIRQESAFNPGARSRARASGLMQLIYPTARLFGVKQPTQLLKPEMNIQAGSKFLGRLVEDFGSVELALAAYNAGPAIVREWQRRYPTDNINLFVEMIPYTETREYVRLVTRNYKIYQSLLIKPSEGDANVAKAP